MIQHKVICNYFLCGALIILSLAIREGKVSEKYVPMLLNAIATVVKHRN
jgi:hypothetical protein